MTIILLHRHFFLTNFCRIFCFTKKHDRSNRSNIYCITDISIFYGIHMYHHTSTQNLRYNKTGSYPNHSHRSCQTKKGRKFSKGVSPMNENWGFEPLQLLLHFCFLYSLFFVSTFIILETFTNANFCRIVFGTKNRRLSSPAFLMQLLLAFFPFYF